MHIVCRSLKSKLFEIQVVNALSHSFLVIEATSFLCIFIRMALSQVQLLFTSVDQSAFLQMDFTFISQSKIPSLFSLWILFAEPHHHHSCSRLCLVFCASSSLTSGFNRSFCFDKKKRKMRNNEIRDVGWQTLQKKVREARLRWYEHVIRRDEGELVRDIME